MKRHTQEIKSFSDEVKKAIEHGKKFDLAQHFGVRTDIVDEWSFGRSCPAKKSRQAIVDWIYLN